MRHVSLTCKNHPNLRWSCKSIAYTPGCGYNGQRNLFFFGMKEHQMPPEQECSCPENELVLAPEDEWSALSIEEQKIAINRD